MEKFLLVFCISLIGLFLLIGNAFLFYSKKEHKDLVYMVMTVFLVVDAVNEVVCNFSGIMYPGSNLIMAHTHYHLHLIFGSLLFYHLLSSFFKKVIVVITLLFYLFTVYYYIQNPSILFEISFPETLVIAIMLIIYALIYLFQSIENEKKYFFYFSIGLIMYLLCSSIVFFTGNMELVFLNDPYIDIWVLNSIFFIIYQLLINKDWKQITQQSNG